MIHSTVTSKRSTSVRLAAAAIGGRVEGHRPGGSGAPAGYDAPDARLLVSRGCGRRSRPTPFEGGREIEPEKRVIGPTVASSKPPTYNKGFLNPIVLRIGRRGP